MATGRHNNGCGSRPCPRPRPRRRMLPHSLPRLRGIPSHPLIHPPRTRGQVFERGAKMCVTFCSSSDYMYPISFTSPDRSQRFLTCTIPDAIHPPHAYSSCTGCVTDGERKGSSLHPAMPMRQSGALREQLKEPFRRRGEKGQMSHEWSGRSGMT